MKNLILNHFRRIGAVFAVAVLPLTAIAAEEEAPAAPAEEPTDAPDTASVGTFSPTDLDTLRTHKGRVATVEGTIERAGESHSQTVRYLNFPGGRAAASLVFFVKIGGEAFALDRLKEYVGKRVRATGRVGEHQDVVQIVITDLSQIEVLEEAPPATTE